MRLFAARTLEGIKPVLQDPQSLGPDPVYIVFSDASSDIWANLTVISSGKLGKEYPKTFGHYHGAEVNETYHLIEGEGVLVLQKKHLKDGKWIEDMVDEVILVRVKPGEEVVITPEYGHSWSNVGGSPLLSFDDWRAGHSPLDYQVIEKMHGLAYYLVEENGEVKAVPNTYYRNLPQPKWMSAAEFVKR